MRSYIGNQHVIGNEEFEELALGIDRDLFLGVQGESGEERAAREAAARDILADLMAKAEDGDEVDGWDALYAEALTHLVTFPRHSAARDAWVARVVAA
ncbi:hypothetical protein G3I60_28390 [Streptomyces sp. SID13666]|uniref:hypothetical protein n=1 Tax=unclassified Streptomyces TaxID=2593676 RepID=UPI0013C152C4|nr:MULTISPECIES: hypothetical protein [unclassified Streptomyces]NEA57974.1 hypothetical protein [Streptomyces sp. SID13666]NEA72832.1 hypothetical protein [Streptomyces sp. SID13588]